MIRSEEKMLEICDVIAGGTLSYADVCRAVGVKERTFWYWIKNSQQGDEDYLVDFLGERVQFAKAVNASRRMALHEARGLMEQKSIRGYDEVVIYMGQVQWQVDRRTVGWTPDEREAYGFDRDGYLRNEAGEVLPQTIHHEAAIALQLRVAEMAFPNEYRPGTNTNVSVSGGLAVVGIKHFKPQDLSDKPPVIPPAPEFPKLEVLDAPDELQIPEIDEKPWDMDDLDPEPATATALPEPETNIILADEPATAEENVIREPTPQKYQSAPDPLLAPKSMSPSWRAEWDRLVARKTAVPDKLDMGGGK